MNTPDRLMPDHPPADTPIIIAEQVSKRYTRAERISLRYEAMNLVRRWFRRSEQLIGHTFYALKDVSFTIQRGESVGIVGRNGSGKTTLLRLLSGIAQPTRGHLRVNGTFAALIGLGAGFLPEMSGRKNIYLNAAIHGKMPHEVDEIIDEIIDFAEIRPFIDSPVKHYSTGMAARLGFSIAVNILPDMVFVDEVLSVGDEAFQSKSFERMLQLREQHRTIVFVSHSSASVRRMCKRALWLHDGRLMADGPADEVLARYQEALAHPEAVAPVVE